MNLKFKRIMKKRKAFDPSVKLNSDYITVKIVDKKLTLYTLL